MAKDMLKRIFLTALIFFCGFNTSQPAASASQDTSSTAPSIVYDKEQKNKVYQGETLFSEYTVRKIISTAGDGSVRMTLILGMLKEVSAQFQFLAPVSSFVQFPGQGNGIFRYHTLGLTSQEEIQTLLTDYSDTNTIIATFAFQLLNQPRNFAMTKVDWIDIIMEQNPDTAGQTKTITFIHQGDTPEDSIRIFKENPVILRVPEKSFTLELFDNPLYQTDQEKMARTTLENQLSLLKTAGFAVEDEVNNNKPVLIAFFDADCPHCQATKPVLEDIRNTHPGDTAIHTIMLDSHPDLARKLGIKSVPSYYLFYKDQETIEKQRLQGEMSRDDFYGLLKIQDKEE